MLSHWTSGWSVFDIRLTSRFSHSIVTDESCWESTEGDTVMVASNKSQKLSAADLKALRQAVADLHKPDNEAGPKKAPSVPSVYYTR